MSYFVIISLEPFEIELISFQLNEFTISTNVLEFLTFVDNLVPIIRYGMLCIYEYFSHWVSILQSLMILIMLSRSFLIPNTLSVLLYLNFLSIDSIQVLSIS